MAFDTSARKVAPMVASVTYILSLGDWYLSSARVTVNCGALPAFGVGVKPSRRTAASAWACSLGTTSLPLTVMVLVSGYMPPRVPSDCEARPSTTLTTTGWPWPTGANCWVSLGCGLSCCGLWAQPARLRLATANKPTNRRCNMRISPEKAAKAHSIPSAPHASHRPARLSQSFHAPAFILASALPHRTPRHGLALDPALPPPAPRHLRPPRQRWHLPGLQALRHTAGQRHLGAGQRSATGLAGPPAAGQRPGLPGCNAPLAATHPRSLTNAAIKTNKYALSARDIVIISPRL
ncbi:hypothetical protein EMIT047CA2_20084 [Pseudomonas soli]